MKTKVKIPIITCGIIFVSLFAGVILLLGGYFVFLNNNTSDIGFSLPFFKDNYENGISLMNEGKYEQALKEFEKIDSKSKNFNLANGKIYYVKGIISYKNKLMEEAFDLFNKVEKDDDVYRESQNYISKIESDPVYLYDYGVSLIKKKKYDDALSTLEKIPSDYDNFRIVKNKIKLAQGFKYYSLKQFEEAKNFLESYDDNDQYFSKDVSTKLEQANKQSNLVKNYYYVEQLSSILIEFLNCVENQSHWSADDISNHGINNLLNIKNRFDIHKKKVKYDDKLIKEYENNISKIMDSYIQRNKTFVYYANNTFNDNNYFELMYSRKRAEFEKYENNLKRILDGQLIELHEKYGQYELPED